MGRSKNLRKIKIEGITYLWTLNHIHKSGKLHSNCIEVLKVYREGYKNSPSKIKFNVSQSIKKAKGPNMPHWKVGYPKDGVAWKTGDNYIEINLNRPGVVSTLIKFALAEFWFPETKSTPTDYPQGFDLLEKIKLPS
ncbi:MAG: hypothetical protein GY804_01240 [Alphaproteobacteria bacterium]|nr:hypothetical protein [Alphaproteobacteria bacterium]